MEHPMPRPATIESIMSRQLVCVDLDATLRSIRDIFERHQFHHVLVLDDGKLAGIISDRDLLKNLSPFVGTWSERSQDASSLGRKAHQVMTRRPITVPETTPIATAGQIMLTKKVSCLPIVGSQGGPIGLVTWRDIMRWAVDQLDDAQGRMAA
jgi:acetoin utilization protein AcuB